MNVIDETTWLSKLSKQALTSLAHNNERIVKGSTVDLVHPAYEEVDDQELFNEIESILATVHLTEQLRKIEDSNRSKFGPRSHAMPWVERKESLYAYFAHEDYDPGGFDEAYGRMLPVSPGQVRRNLLKSSSAGLPYMMKKGLVLDKAFRSYESELGVYPCVLYTRTQEQRKTRGVWAFPISDTILEQTYLMPFLNGVERRLSWRQALNGPEAVDEGVTNLLLRRTDNDLVYCVDFSAYDATVKPEHSYGAFAAIANQFQPQCSEELYRIYRRFVTIPVYTPDGEVVGPHGVPSGSSFTNTVDSLVQFQASGRNYNCQIQGDDGIYLIPKNERDSFPERFKRAGLTLNESKSQVFDTLEGVFLQRYYSPEYRKAGGSLGGVYSAYRAFNRIKYLERWTDFEGQGLTGSDFFALRTIMILENCKHHPAFPQIVQMAQSFDRDGLAFSEQGVHQFAKMMESKTRANVMTADLRGIHAFETVKLLKT